MVHVESVTDEEKRNAILETVLEHDKALTLRDAGEKTPLDDWFREDDALKSKLDGARKRLERREVEVPKPVLERCVAIAGKVGAEGHRGEMTLALAARALAARSGAKKVTAEHVRKVAPLALQHRRSGVAQADGALWGPAQKAVLDEVLGS
jgi:magnesium chelatase subunit I